MDTNQKNYKKALTLFRTMDQSTEMRIISRQRVPIEVFRSTSENQLLEKISEYDGLAHIFVVMNPFKNVAMSHHSAIRDSQIIKRIWIMIDIDLRKEAENKQRSKNPATTQARVIQEVLTQREWPQPVMADSGNGAHLLYPVEMMNTSEINELIKAFLKCLSESFSTLEVKIDPVTYNASRLCRVYGTKNPKETIQRTSLIWAKRDQSNVTVQQLKDFIDVYSPEQESLSEIQEVISNEKIRVIKKDRWKSIADRYVLNPCPFNPDHLNQSAYILHFDSGAVVAGCHHSSCKEKGWKEIKSLLKISTVRTELSPSSLLIQLAERAQYYRDDLEEGYASIELKGHRELYKVKSQKFRKWLTFLYYKKTGKAPSSESMSQALSVIETKAMFEGNPVSLNRRVAQEKGYFFYDMGDENWTVIQLYPGGWKIMETPPVLFIRNKNMKGQLPPGRIGDVHLIDNHFRFNSKDQLLLFKVYLIHCFIPDIPHLIAIFHGEKGSSKTTSVRKARRIVDPAARELLTMPKGKNELALSLANNYMPAYDNLDKLQSHQSELICIASTGGGLSKRTLYTDEDETILNFKRCVVLNGINIVATRPDLLDRAILLELQRIPSHERKEESVLWSDFDQDLPSIFTGILDTISKAMTLYPSLHLTELPRMADACKWGYAIAEAMGESGNNFLKVYKENQRETNRETIADHPVAAAVVALMKSKQIHESSVSELLSLLEKIAVEEKINVMSALWPKASNVLSKRLKEVKSNLAEIDIEFEFQNSKNATRIRIITKTNRNEEEQ